MHTRERILLERKAKRKISREFRKFRRTTLLYATKIDLWNSSTKITFFDSVHEYFEYNEEIPDAYLKLAVIEPALMHLLWQAYQKDESLDFCTWEGISEILERVLLSWRVLKAA